MPPLFPANSTTDAQLDAHVDLDKPRDSDIFHITWPEKLPECHGVCERAEGVGYGAILSDQVRQDGERGCPRCQIIYHSCRDLESTGATLEVDCASYRPGMIWISLKGPGKLWSHTLVQIYVELGTPEPAWEYIKPRRILTTKRRDEYKPILHSWIDKCNKSHTDCIKTNAELPHTVLDVGSQDNPHLSLHVSSNQVGQYTALSHCWGKSSPPKTTTENIEQYKRHISFDELPKSFQDAVTVTRDLGIRYLWIDSLCIQQDDKYDWQKESSRMADYYNHAYLVIAASQAKDPTQGFLDSMRNSSTITHHSRKHIGNITNPDSSTSRIYQEKLSQSFWSQRHRVPLTHSPLNKRAWVFQEYLLAKRIVHFTANELLWECVEDLECECLETKYSSWDGTGTGGIVRKVRYLNPDDYLDKDSTRLEHWLGILTQYSRLAITKSSDVLPALSGLAKFWQSPETGKYLAGFWENNIIESILWERWHDRDGLYVEKALQRSRRYRAPSWSPFSIEDADRYRHRRMLIPIFISPYKVKKCVVRDVRVTAAGADSTGEVKSGYIELEGLVTRLDIEPLDEHAMETEIELQGETTKVEWDIEMDLRQGLHVALLYMHHDHDSLQALVLKTCQGAYERVGVLYLELHPHNEKFEYIAKCLQAGTKEIVTII